MAEKGGSGLRKQRCGREEEQVEKLLLPCFVASESWPATGYTVSISKNTEVCEPS